MFICFRGNVPKNFRLTQTIDSTDFYSKLNAINQLLLTEYIAPDELSGLQDQMQENALKSYVAGINDPYTNYLTAKENTDLINILKEDTGISGIGAVVEKRDTYVQIEEIIKNGPAYQAGLLPLDRILYIETGSTQDLSTSEAVERIRGAQGTEVNLLIQRQTKTGHLEEFTVKITRDHIELPSVVAKLIEKQGKKV
ncbi:MAG: PDZ domain-containing protein [Candidatus Peribacteria bacterium]|nr:PDZ domain-containing protein [Candidatus Peribacteria bacterium]